MKRVKVNSENHEPFCYNPGGGPSPNSTANGAPKNVKVIVIHAGFGDATLLEVEHDNGGKNHFLIDGGPTHIETKKYRFFENLIETLLARCALDSGEFKLDGIMVTHPDSDHSQGIIKLFQEFPPNKKATNRASFVFKGPLLLTKAFWKKGSDERDFVSDTLRQSKFVGKIEENGSPILGFEKLFNFYYPDPNATGVVYNFVNPSPDPYPSPGNAPVGFDSNKTSILMLVNDPAEPSKPLISLNGDGSSQSILQLIKDKPLKIFKVPHHGSRNNSLPLNRCIPDGQLVTKRCLATQALLELVMRPQRPSLAKILVGDKCEAFVANFREIRDDQLFYIDALSYKQILREVAELFEVEVKKIVHDTDQLLSNLEIRKKKIEANLTDDSIQAKNKYTNGTSIPDFIVKKYTQVKQRVINEGERQDDDVSDQREKVKYRKFEAFNSIFKYLETDGIFLDKVMALYVSEFYSHINAETFFISSGNSHDHPHSCVINGIIEAAKKKHAEKSSYSCRLLLTSGHNIKESKLPDYPSCEWKKFVSLQYFLGTTASVVIDPNVLSSSVIEGTKQWDGPGEKSSSLRSEYDNTEGARALEILRATPDNHSYQVTSINSSWLFVTNGKDIQLSTTKKVINVKNIPYKRKHYDTVFKMTFQSDADDKAKVYGLAGYHVPGEPHSYKLFVYDKTRDKKDRQYLCDDRGTLKLTAEQGATSFKFAKEPLPSTHLQSQSLSNKENAIKKNTLVSRGMDEPIMRKRLIESAERMQTSMEGMKTKTIRERGGGKGLPAAAKTGAITAVQPGAGWTMDTSQIPFEGMKTKTIKERGGGRGLPSAAKTGAISSVQPGAGWTMDTSQIPFEGMKTKSIRERGGGKGLPAAAKTGAISSVQPGAGWTMGISQIPFEVMASLFCNTSKFLRADSMNLHSFLTSAYGAPLISETLEESQHHLSPFLREITSWKLNNSSSFQDRGEFLSANIVMKPPSAVSLVSRNIESVILKTMPSASEFKIKIETGDINGIPTVLTYRNIQWCKSIKGGHSTLVVNQAKAKKSFTSKSSKKLHPSSRQLSVEDYLISVGFNGDATSIPCETLLDLLLTEQVVSQLKNSHEMSTKNSSFYRFMLAMLTWALFDSSTVIVSEEEQVTECNLKLKLPSTPPKLNDSNVQKVVLKINNPSTPYLKLRAKLTLDDNESWSTTTQTYKLEYFLPQNFGMFLQAIGVTPPDGGFDLFDAVILLLQSETTGYFVFNSFTKALISMIRGYRVDQQSTVITFYTSPTNVFLSDEAQIVADIVDSNNKLDIGLSNHVILRKLAIFIPLCIFDTYISAEVEIGDQELKMCAQMMPDSLPSIEFKFIKLHSLIEVLTFLQLDLEIRTLHIPILSEKLAEADGIISEAGFTISQAVDESNTTTLSSLFFCVNFSNLNSYLPHFFNKLRNIQSRAVVYFPSIPSARKVGLNTTFSFVLQKLPAVTLSATLKVWPVLGAGVPTDGYNFSVAITTTATEGVSLADMLSGFGLNNALSSAMEIPIVKSILANVHIKEFTIDLNTKKKTIEAFSLHLHVPEWELIPNKISITMFDLYMSYSLQSWDAVFESNAILGSKYCVFVKFKLSAKDSAVINIKNHNQDLSMAAFLSIFGLNIDSIPLINQVLQICIIDVHLSIKKPFDKSTISVEQGSVTLFVESFQITPLLCLKQVNLQINFTKDESTQIYSYGFHVAGFVNDKVYLDVGYNPDDRSLFGHALISSFKEADLSCIANTFLAPSNYSSLETSNIYKPLSSSTAAEISLAFQLGDHTSLRLLQIGIKGRLKLFKTLYLTSMQFEYIHNSKDGEIKAASSDKQFPTDTSLSVLATMCSDKSKFYALLKFDLSKDSEGSKTITASLRPTRDHGLTLSSFLSLLELSTPDIPSVEGQTNPPFLDLELTLGSLTFSISPYNIQAFNLQIESPNTIELMASPKILLEKVALNVAYDKRQSSTSTTQVFLLGIISLAGIKLCLEGSKNKDGLIFKSVVSTTMSALAGSKTEFSALIKDLTPHNCAVPILPSDAGLPTSLPFGVAEMKISLLHNEKSFVFCGAAQNLNWKVSLGFKTFIVNKLGGKIQYNKEKFTCVVTGQFQLSSDKTINSELYFGNGMDTTLVVLIESDANLKVGTLIDNTLDFKTSFNSLLPKSAHTINYTDIYINLNLSKSHFLVAGKLKSLGTGFLFAGKFGKEHYGYAFGIALPVGFKFSQLLPDFSLIDDILHVRKANVIILSLPDVKVSAVVAAMKDAQKNFIFQNKKPIELPFSNLILDDNTKNKPAGKGMSFYAEIDFNTANPNSVFSSIDKIRDRSSSFPDVVLSAQISSSEPERTRFEAHIKHLVLSDYIKLQNLTLHYQPYNQNSLTLVGDLLVCLNSDSDAYTYRGEMNFTNTEAKLSLTNDPTSPIINPFGMSGISLEKISLLLKYTFPKNEPHTSFCEISGDVGFYSHYARSSERNNPPTICLKGKVSFVNCTPVLVMVTIEPSKTLTISDFVATVFKWDYGSNLKTGFTNGRIYYAKPTQGHPSLKIDDQTYDRGYHISADVEVFSNLFNIKADIDDEKISISGSAYTPFDLGFIKLIGINDQSELDESKSPELSFTTTKDSTVVKVTGGVVIFGAPLAKISMDYNVTNKVFSGELEYAGDIELFKNTSLHCSWSSNTGFQITKWPISNPLPFDFFAELKKFTDLCGNLADLETNSAIETKLNINTKLSESVDPKLFIAMVDITGTYDVCFSGGVCFTAVEIPAISKGIPTNISHLNQLPRFILTLLAEYAAEMVEKIAKDPKKLATILGVMALKSITSQVAGTLKCRNVSPEDLDPDIGSNEDLSKQDFERAGQEIEKAYKLIEKVTQSLTNMTLQAIINTGGWALKAIGIALVLLGGIIIATTSFVVVYKINAYLKRKEEAERLKLEVEEKQKEFNELIESVLHINSPIAEFCPPDMLKIHWKSNGYSGNSYHVRVNGTLLTKESAFLYDEIVSSCSVEVKKEELYNATQLTVTIQNIKSSDNGHTFKGKKCIIEVPNVHPTLHPPVLLTKFESSSMLIIAELKSPVRFANKYSFQLGERSTISFKEISRPFFVPCKYQNMPIKHSFSHSIIPTESIGPLAVRCQALCETSVDTYTSALVYSNSLKLAPPVSDFRVVLPHFQSKSRYVNITWSLPLDISEIAAIACQVLRMDTETCILLQTLEEEQGQAFPTSCQFSVKDIIELLLNDKSLQSATKPNSEGLISLGFQVYTNPKNDQVVSSVFVKQIFQSLKPPPSVSFKYSPDAKELRIVWELIQETNEYGIEILDDKHVVLLSELVLSDNKETSFYFSINQATLDRYNITNAKMVYTIQVASVTSGNKKFDSIIPTAAQENVRVCMSPRGTSLCYSCAHNTVIVIFSPVLNATAYVVKILGPKDRVLAEVEKKPYEFNAEVKKKSNELSKKFSCSIDTDKFQLLSSGDVITAALQSVGGGVFLSSAVLVIPNVYLTVRQQPSNVTYSYLPDEDTITLKCDTVRGIEKYMLGLHDPSGLEEDVIVPTLINSTSGSISASKLRSLEVALWKAFALSVGDSTHLPSPRTIMKNDVMVLSIPSIKSFLYNEPLNLSVFWDKVLHSSGYKVHLEVLDKENSTLYNKVKEVSSTVVTISFKTSVIPEWPSVLKKLNSARASVTAVGSGYFITSLPGDRSSITRLLAPQKLQYKYNPVEDLITLSFVRVPNILEYVVGFSWQGKVIMDDDVKCEKDTISCEFSTDKLLSGDKWKAFVQSHGDTTHFPSHKTFLEHDIYVLQKPHVESCTYNMTSKELTVIWTGDPRTSHFVIRVVSSKSDGTDLGVLEKIVHPEKASPQTKVVNMGNEIKDWESTFQQMSTVTVSVRAIGSEFCLSSCNSKPHLLCRIDSPGRVSLKSSRGKLAVMWNAVNDATAYNTDIVVNDKLVYHHLFPQSCSDIGGIDLMLLISQVPVSQLYNIRALVTSCSTSSQLPGMPEEAQILIDSKVHKSNEFGSPGEGRCDKVGTPFDDIHSQKDLSIVGIKAIRISYGDHINSLKTEYILTDGSTYVASKNGGVGKHETYIEFDTGEKLAAVHGSMTDSAVDQMSFTTKTKLGSYKEYGPYGSSGPSSSFSVEGNILGFHGKSGSVLNSIGVYFTQLWQKYYKSSSWGGHGSPLDDSIVCLRVPDDTIDNLSSKGKHQKSHLKVKSIDRIKELCIKYDEFIGSLEVCYELDDGLIVSLSKHGKSGKFKNAYRLKNGEIISEVRGQVNDNVVAQLAYETTMKDGTKRTHGPFGSFGSQAFIVRGEIKAFYSQSSENLNSIGVYFLPFKHTYNKSPCWGGSSGILFDDSEPYIKYYTKPDLGNSLNDPFSSPASLCEDKWKQCEIKAYVTGIKEIWIRHRQWIDSLKVNYLLSDGSTRVSDQHGGNGGQESHIRLDDGEKIVSVSGETIKGTMNNHPWSYIARLTFETKTRNGSQRVYGPYGESQHQRPFLVQGNVVAFYGQSKLYLDSIGFYFEL